MKQKFFNLLSSWNNALNGWMTGYVFRYSMISKIASGSKISVEQTKNPRFVILTSSECKATSIVLDLLRFGEATEITFGFVSHHR